MRDDETTREESQLADDGDGFVVVDVTEYELDRLPHEVEAFETTGAAPAPIPDEGGEEFATALALAHEALAEVTEPSRVGEFAGLVDEGEGVYSLRFASSSPGHRDWFWTVSLDRLDDEDVPSVLEVELLPGDDALLAPEWVPWAERLAEYRATHDRQGNPLPDSAEDDGESAEAETEAAPRADRARTSSRTRTRRRRRRDREAGAGESAGDAG